MKKCAVPITQTLCPNHPIVTKKTFFWLSLKKSVGHASFLHKLTSSVLQKYIICWADVFNLWQETLLKSEIQKLFQSPLIHPTTTFTMGCTL